MSQRKHNTPIQVTVPSHSEGISGLVLTAMALGTLVAYKQDGAAGDPRTLVAASGVRGFVLTQDVLSQEDWEAYAKAEAQFPTSVRSKLPVGSPASALGWDFIEAEGADGLDASIVEFVPNQPVTTNNGKLCLWDGYLADRTGTMQVETATAAGTVTKAGNATVTVTSALVAGSPLAVAVAVALNDTASQWAAKVRTALANNAAIAEHYSISGSGTAIVLTAKVAATNDATLNVAIDNGTCEGITPAASSADTTAGVAPSPAPAHPGEIVAYMDRLVTPHVAGALRISFRRA